MSVTDFAAATNSEIIRIHRATCKKLPLHTISLEQFLSTGSTEGIRDAVPATCCKPKAAMVYVEEALNDDIAAPSPVEAERQAELGVDDRSEEQVEHEVQTASLETGYADELAAEKAGEITRVVHAQFTGPKYLWRAAGKLALRVLADEPITSAKVNADQTVSIETADWSAATDLVNEVEQTWTEAVAAFKVWRKTDKAYKALPPRGSAWSTSERFRAEESFIAGFVR